MMIFIPDSKPDSDLSISTVHSSDTSNLGEEWGESGTDEIGELGGLKIFGGLPLTTLLRKVGPNCPMALILQWQHQMNILSFFSCLRCLN